MKVSKRILYPGILIFLSVLLFIANYTHGTFLTGWDNLHPEFNILLNLKRNLFAVWQGYRGLGLIDGQAHSANLIHTFITGLFSLVVPMNMIRYIVILLLHVSGGLGFLAFAKKMTRHEDASFIGALFYMFSLITIQQFFAPLEAFAFHFAALPWLFLFAHNYFENNDRKSLILFAITTVLTTPQSFIPTLFVIFFGFFSIFCIYNGIVQKKIRPLLTILLTFIFLNSFWLLPYLYHLPEKTKTITEARINEFSSEEAYFRNRARGDLLSVLTMKGFMMDMPEFDAREERIVHFTRDWVTHTNNPLYIVGFFSILLISFYGLFKERQNKTILPFTFITIGSLLFLANNTFLLKNINDLIRTLFPILNEALRFPFTKFSTMYLFGFSILFVFGLTHFFKRFHLIQKKLAIIGFCVVLFLSLPAFTGHFFSPILRQQIPQDYFDSFNYLKEQNHNNRVAYLPAHTFWSWQSREWGYVGSGFEWFGISQPLLDRAFDPWSKHNEQAYTELAYAISSENKEKLSSVINKYNISYLFFDGYVVNNVSSKPINTRRIKQFLYESDVFSIEKTYGKIILFKSRTPQLLLNSYTTRLPKIAPSFINMYSDSAYIKYNIYQNTNSNADIIYPFRSLYSETNKNRSFYKAKLLENTISFTTNKTIPLKKGDYLLSIPSLTEYEGILLARLTLENKSLNLAIEPPVIIINTSIVPQESILLQFPIQNSTVSEIMYTENNTSIQNGDLFYIRNNSINVFELKGDTMNEFITVDTRKIQANPSSFFVSGKEINDITVKIPNIPFDENGEMIISKHNYSIIQNNIIGRSVPSWNNLVTEKNGIKVRLKGAGKDIVLNQDYLPHDNGYIIFIDYDYKSGLSPTFWVDNYLENRSEFEAKLTKNQKQNVFLLPPYQQYFDGYSFHIGVKSVGTELTESNINEVNIFPFPYETLKHITFVKQGYQENKMPQNNAVPFNENNPISYILNITSDVKTITLNQAFETGWSAYTIDSNSPIAYIFPGFFGEKLEGHVMINNWANAWLISQKPADQTLHEPSTNSSEKTNGKLRRGGTSIVIIFWPQYLQFTGFGIVILTVLGIIILKKRTKLNHTPIKIS